jgi:hypothetical protein
MMKIIAIKAFRDKYSPAKLYSPGTVISDFDDARAKDLVLRGLAAIVKGEAETAGGNAGAPAAPATESSRDSKDGGDSRDAPTVGAPAEDALRGIDLTRQHLKVIAAVKVFADVEKLKSYLAEENASVKPRASVVDAMKERIAELETSGNGNTEEF